MVPFHRATPASQKCIETVLALTHEDFELIVVSDRPVDLPMDDPRVVAVVTGSSVDTSPAEKRDLASEKVTGDVIAYLDDDAYPVPNWLHLAEVLFANPDISALGGPGLTPSDSSWASRAGGAVYESWLGSGPLRYRFRPQAPRVVTDYPAYNLMVRTEAVRHCGGWASTFYGGEDTRFCENLAAIGVYVHYSPELIVYHHRRPVFREHLRQVANVGRHRGYFVRIHPESSRRPMYFLPAATVLGTPLVVMMAERRNPGRGLKALAIAYLAAAAMAPERNAAAQAVFPVALAAHHGAYGIAFVRGLLTKQMNN